MSLRSATIIARRELKAGIHGFRIFLLCLTLGIAAIAAVGSVRESIHQGLTREGAILLGGDAEIALTYRFASDEERRWMVEKFDAVSEIVDFRSMAVFGQGGSAVQGLTQLKAVDDNYPLLGRVMLEPAMSLSRAFEGQGGLPGAVMDRLLVDRLGLAIGGNFRLGSQNFVLSAILLSEPDNVVGGFTLGPRTIVRRVDLAGSGLLQPGTLFESSYRLKIPAGGDPQVFKDQVEKSFVKGGYRWRDRRDGAPGTRIFVDRLGSFLILVGLAGLAVGGVGVSAAVRAYLDRKMTVIATLKTLGADGRTVLLAYMLQIGVLTVLGITLGLLLGASLPLLLGPLISAGLPLPIEQGLYLRPLAEAALYGILAAILFTLWPLSRTNEIRAAALFREAGFGVKGWPHWSFIFICSVVLLALIVAMATFSGSPRLALWVFAGLAGAYGVLLLVALLLRHLAQWMARGRFFRGFIPLRLALASIGGPGSETTSVVLSLGLGLSVLATVGQIDTNLRDSLARNLPDIAPSFFVVDIQPDQMPAFLARMQSDPGVERIETAPMLRGIINRFNGRPATELAGDHWVIHGDRGVTFSTDLPSGSDLTKGEWWPPDYTGAPLASFSSAEAEEIGLALGDTLTVNILGRDITATISSFRDVDFSNAGMGFILSLNPAAIEGAPHTYISTIYASDDSQAAILRDLAEDFPNITAISVGDAIGQVAKVMGNIAAAITYGALITLLTGIAVLVGAAAAGEHARSYEAAMLKTLGAERRTILASFLLRSTLLGAAAGMVAIATGAVAGWAVMEFVMDAEFAFATKSALWIITGGIAVTLVSSALFSIRSLETRPATVLRTRQ